MGRIGLVLAPLAGAISVGATPSTAIAQNQGIELTPSGQWTVDFADNKCRLVRVFGEGKNQHLMFFEQWAPNGGFGFTVAGPGFEKFRRSSKVTIGFLPEGKLSETKPFLGIAPPFGRALVYSSLGLGEPAQTAEPHGANVPASSQSAVGIPALDIERAKKVERIEITQRNRRVTFSLDYLGAAFKVLNNCSQDLLTTWGLDLEQQRSATKRPKPLDIGKVAREIQENYPGKALRAGESGIMRVRLLVDEEGKVTDCLLFEATRSKHLKSTACDQLRETEFEPALDAEGNPMSSYFATIVTYKLRE